ncbi:SpdA protein [Actinacidiphila sp. DG2A-62]|uniref:SpdA protein n=1 Tax=Actinacidiphila sp. DG2A-62 TaxID=3108821 RepID=UPI002DB91B95|nr:SpdA protein [Actinacidiphila sp. DG2A-62]MEC3995347.1 SpdA protein [Actinacidiphila sp. DG2A-62]
MPTTPPDHQPVATGALARTTITTVMAVIAALAFIFSFGNVWALALRPATRLMHLCGLLTLALNTAQPLLARHYARAALDTVAPALLLGWATVGPTLLHHLHTPPAEQRPAPAAPVVAATLPPRAPTAAPARARPPGKPTPAAPGKRTGRPPAATMTQLIAIARPAVAQHGLTTAVVKQALRDTATPISSARLTQLMQHLKNEHHPAPPEPEREREPARAHPAQT